jgi:NADPH2:quinone reductase
VPAAPRRVTRLRSYQLPLAAVIRYDAGDFVAETRRLTDGRGVDVVYDSVGRTTFDGSLRCLRARGLCVLFGQASGAVEPFDPQRLNQGGSLFLTRPGLAHYVATPDKLRMRAHAVFAGIAAGWLRVRIDRRLPLTEAAEAHRLLEGRHTAGKLLLVTAG